MDRRRIVGMGAALATAGVVGRGAAAQDGTPGATPAGGTAADGSWSFTDPKGVTVTLPAAPERLALDVNVAAPLWDYGIRPVALFGWNVNPDGTLTDAGGDVDPTGIALVGDSVEPVKVEPLVAADPDLVVTLTWEPDNATEYWSLDFDADVLAQVQSRYPIATLPATVRADEGVEQTAAFARLLGADLDTPELAAARDAFAAKVTEATAAIAAKPDLTVQFFSQTESGIYLANAEDWGDIAWYQALGLQVPDLDLDAGEFWRLISPEEIGAYPADVMFRSTRPESVSAEALAADPVTSLHPAIAAGQVFDWNQDFILSYRGMTVALDAVLTAVTTSEKVT